MITMEKTTRVSVTWKNGSKAEIYTHVIFRAGHILDDIRRELSNHPVMGEVYWRDDLFDPDVFHAHHKVKCPFDALGASIAQAYIVRK